MAGDIVVLCAMKKEAEALLFHSKYKFKKENGYFIYNINDINIKVFITGIGRDRVVKFTEKNNFDNTGLIIKAGTWLML